MKELLSKKQRDEIVSAVKDAEAKTSAEFAWSVQNQSNEYKDIQLKFGIYFSLILSALFTAIEVLYGWGSWSAILSVELVLFFLLGMFIGKIDWVRRLIISRDRKRKTVKEKAHSMFTQFGISNTKQRNGVFIYASIAEKLVYIIFDSGITSRINIGVLNKRMQDIISKKNNRYSIASGIAESIRYAGEELKKKFPRSNDDVNELPDDDVCT